ncbi:Modification methylase DpnIIB [compost metagenome]
MSASHQILVGDCLDLLRQIPDQTAHCCITSPPYYGLRDYGVDGQIGLEESPAGFIARLVEVFREVRRVLRSDGTCWVNMGDSYRPDKQLMGIPWRLALALQDDGWHLRQDIIWNKPNPMPESVRDRCTKAHEYLFLLSKSPRYYFDQGAIREPAGRSGKGNANGFRGGAYVNSSTFDNATGGKRTSVGNFATPAGWDTSIGEGGHGSFHRDGAARGSRRNSFARESKYTAGAHGQKAQHRPGRDDIDYSQTRNKRSVWTVATRGFSGAHFATFPPDLIRPCILAGTPRGGLVLDPFGGAGTAGLVAMQEGRRSLLLELNPEYAELARHRLADAWLDGAAQMDMLLDQKEIA